MEIRTELKLAPDSQISTCGQAPIGKTDDKYDVCIVIVNYNGVEFLVDALQRTYDAIKSSLLRYQLILVDNNSSDRSAELAQMRFPELKIVALGSQVGFAAANNVGVRVAPPSELVLFLNSDAWLCPGAIEQMVGFLRDHPHYGAVAPVEQRPDGRIHRTWRSIPRPFNILLDLLFEVIWFHWFPKSINLDIKSRRWKKLASKPVIRVPFLPGYCLLVRFFAFHQAGWWDELYDFYCEDDDLSYRLTCDGWLQGIITKAFAVHIGSASTKASSIERAEKLRAARKIFCYKHFPYSARVVEVLAKFLVKIVPKRTNQLKNILQQLATGPNMEISTTRPLR